MHCDLDLREGVEGSIPEVLVVVSALLWEILAFLSMHSGSGAVPHSLSNPALNVFSDEDILSRRSRVH